MNAIATSSNVALYNLTHWVDKHKKISQLALALIFSKIFIQTKKDLISAVTTPQKIIHICLICVGICVFSYAIVYQSPSWKNYFSRKLFIQAQENLNSLIDQKSPPLAQITQALKRLMSFKEFQPDDFHTKLQKASYSEDLYKVLLKEFCKDKHKEYYKSLQKWASIFSINPFNSAFAHAIVEENFIPLEQALTLIKEFITEPQKAAAKTWIERYQEDPLKREKIKALDDSSLKTVLLGDTFLTLEQLLKQPGSKTEPIIDAATKLAQLKPQDSSLIIDSLRNILQQAPFDEGKFRAICNIKLDNNSIGYHLSREWKQILISGRTDLAELFIKENHLTLDRAVSYCQELLDSKDSNKQKAAQDWIKKQANQEELAQCAARTSSLSVLQLVAEPQKIKTIEIRRSFIYKAVEKGSTQPSLLYLIQLLIDPDKYLNFFTLAPKPLRNFLNQEHLSTAEGIQGMTFIHFYLRQTDSSNYDEKLIIALVSTSHDLKQEYWESFLRFRSITQNDLGLICLAVQGKIKNPESVWAASLAQSQMRYFVEAAIRKGHIEALVKISKFKQGVYLLPPEDEQGTTPFGDLWQESGHSPEKTEALKEQIPNLFDKLFSPSTN